jgi:Fe-S oxidoreductase/nitrate reductase gamma subunit
MTTAADQEGTTQRRIRDLLLYGLGQLRTLKKPLPGILHTLIFWGVIIQVIGTAIKMMQMGLFVPFTWPLFSSRVYLGYELVMDLAGGAIVVGVLLALIRRWMIKPDYIENTWDTYYVLGLLFCMALVGFLTEGLRYISLPTEAASWAPIGRLTAGILTRFGVQIDSVLGIHPYFFWTHVGLGLIFAVSIPFTRLRHIFATPFHIYKQTYRSPGELNTIENLMEADVLGAEKISDFSSRELLSFDACLQCGRCEEVCPATISGMDYSPRVLLKRLRENMAQTLIHPDNGKGELDADLTSESMLWSCTTCGACLDVCPAFIRPPENVVDLRRAQVLMSGTMPGPVGETLRNYERQGNPWGFPPQDRMQWAAGLDIKILEPGDTTDVLFFVGCAGAFDERNQQVTRAFVSLLQAAGVDFGVLGPAEMCCGETARRMGNEYLFQVSAEENIQLFDSIDFSQIVTLCPHGYNSLKHEYPRFGGEYQIQHGAEYLSEIQGKIRFSSHDKHKYGRVTFHDSCYLGRYNNVYAQPRELLELTHIQPLEMADTRQNSFCCGGGGGSMWLETDAETRISKRRLDQAREVQADTIATSCPFCLIMLDDAVRSEGLSDQVQIVDIMEILDDARK